MNREFPIENLPHEAPGAQNISLLLRWTIFISYFYGCSNVGEGCWRKMAVLMLVKDVGEKCMLVKTYIFSRGYFSPTYIKLFTNIHLNFCSKCSPTYRKFFTNILHQHTFNFLFKFFTNIQFFSPTYRKLFANILHQHTY